MALENSELVRVALEVAKRAHSGQFRKDGATPYIEHPVAVAAAFDSPHLKALALLHDVLEDSDITLTELKEMGFPQPLLDSLNRLTRRKLESYADYIVVCGCDPDARRVKIADMRHNLQTSTGTQKSKYELALYVLENFEK